MKKHLVVLVVLSLVIGFASTSFAQEKKYSEAPALAELVKEGKLPPVEERLPEEPLVVEPVEEIGQYGGTWHTAHMRSSPFSLTMYDPLLRWDENGQSIVPNIAKGWEVADDGKSFTFYLREGIKWSDGESFTADDILFWYEDVLLNEELTPVEPIWMKVGDEVGKVEKLGDYAVRFTFSKPNGLFIEHLASSSGEAVCRYPKHYLTQFHPAYVSKEDVEALAKEEGFDTWFSLFLFKADILSNPDLPVLTIWQLRTKPGAPRLVAERNPYYWKVDPQGNQLPYIDRFVVDMVQSADVITLKALSGEIDMQYYGLATLDFPVLLEGREKGGYRVMPAQSAGGTAAACLYLNQNVEDPVLRSLFENRKFRIALSLAINRDEINEFVYAGMSEPRQAVPSKYSPYYNSRYDQFAKSYIEYDPQRANELLDEIGLISRDPEGYRLRPDGKPISITIEFFETIGTTMADTCELLTNYLKDVGIKVAPKPEEQVLWITRITSGQHEAAVYGASGGFSPLAEPMFHFPVATNCYWAPLYGAWYSSGGKSGEEPKGEIKKLLELYEEGLITVDYEKRAEIVEQAFGLHSENLWLIGMVGYAPWPCIVKNNFRNVKQFVVTNEMRGLGYIHPEQFFFKE